MTPCSLAAVGYYVDTVGATSQTACAVGQTTAGTGSTSSSACFTPAPPASCTVEIYAFFPGNGIQVNCTGLPANTAVDLFLDDAPWPSNPLGTSGNDGSFSADQHIGCPTSAYIKVGEVQFDAVTTSSAC